MSVLLRTRHLEYVKIEHYAKNIIHRHTGEVELKIFLFSLIQLSATDKPFKDTAAIFMKKLSIPIHKKNNTPTTQLF